MKGTVRDVGLPSVCSKLDRGAWVVDPLPPAGARVAAALRRRRKLAIAHPDRLFSTSSGKQNE
jgi:hypothetical protein